MQWSVTPCGVSGVSRDLVPGEARCCCVLLRAAACCCVLHVTSLCAAAARRDTLRKTVSRPIPHRVSDLMFYMKKTRKQIDRKRYESVVVAETGRGTGRRQDCS
ncbi:hypothetical protein RR46_04078 [Papilio xuthus]|uniref:Uncharacterized protein n=1 Tax=Papilio xuthus TaxID=66420 RepID=A0A194QHH8_PAPXU|nr:hypothetical protein RR46_04078 [Papilio xuthus]